MTVRELIDELRGCDLDLKVAVWYPSDRPGDDNLGVIDLDSFHQDEPEEGNYLTFVVQ